MRLPRTQITLRRMMVMVALIGVALGVFVGVRTERLRRNYLGSAKRFGELEIAARLEEQLFDLRAGWHKKSMATSARMAAFALKSQQDLDGLSPGRRLEDLDDISPVMQIYLEHAITQGTYHSEQAAEYRARAALAVKRANYFSQLKQKYEHATARAWVRVEPDPPIPK